MRLLERLDVLGGAAVSARVFPGVDANLSRYSYLVSLLPQQIIDDLGADVRLASLSKEARLAAKAAAREAAKAARDLARDIATTDAYLVSRRQRKKVEMLFAHLKRILRMDRLRLRGPNGAKDEFLLAATAQNLRKMAKLIPMPAFAVG